MRYRQYSRNPTLGTVCSIILAACASSDSSQGRVQEWVLTPELRIGTLDGADDALTDVSDLLIGLNGEIYIAQPRDATIRVFDAAGQFIRRIGRSGRGPGEFIWPSRLSWLGDTLAVLDSNLGRVSYFDANGSLLGDAAMAVSATGPYLRSSMPLAVLPNGRAVGVPGYFVDDIDDVSDANRPVLLIDRFGSVIDTLATFPIPPVFVIRRDNSSYQGGQPFRPSPAVRVEPGGEHLYLLEFPTSTNGSSATLRVTKLDVFADTMFSSLYSFAAVPIPESVRDSVHQAVAAVLSQGDPPLLGPGAAISAARESISVPDVYPAANAAFVDDDGRFWFRTPVSRNGLVVWEVLDGEGRRSAQVAAPANASLRNARGNSAWGVELDEFDVPHVARYRISTSSE